MLGAILLFFLVELGATEFLAGFAFLAAGAMEASRSDVFPSGLVLLFGIGFICVGGVSLIQAVTSTSR